MKDKNHQIISINSEKHLTKIQCPLTIKTQERGHTGKINIIKAIYDKLTSNIILNYEKLKAFLQNQE